MKTVDLSVAGGFTVARCLRRHKTAPVLI